MAKSGARERPEGRAIRGRAAAAAPTALTDGLEGHVGEGRAEVGVEEALEDVERDVGEAGVNVGVDGQDHGVRPHHATREDVPLGHRRESVYTCSDGRSTHSRSAKADLMTVDKSRLPV